MMNDVRTEAKRVVISGGAGTGKTSAIRQRVDFLMKERNVQAEEIVVIVRSQRAGRDFSEVSAMTWAQWGAEVIRRHSKEPFAVVGLVEQEEIFSKLMFSLPGLDRYGADDLRRFIHKKNWGDPRPTAEFHKDDRDLFKEFFQLYQDCLGARGKFDFDGVVRKVTTLLSDPTMRSQFSWKHVLIDDFDEISPLETELLKVVLKDETVSLFVAGQEPDLDHFGAHFGEVEEFCLEKNLRSPMVMRRALGEDVDVAGARIAVWQANDEKQEAQVVAQEIEKRIGESDTGRTFDDFAVIFREQGQVELIGEALGKAGLPYRIVGGKTLFERKDILDLIAYLRFLYRPEDNEALLRIVNVPARGLGEKAMVKIVEQAREMNISVFETMQRLDSLKGITPAVRLGVEWFLTLYGGLKQCAMQLGVAELIREILGETGLAERYQKGEKKHECLMRLLSYCEKFERKGLEGIGDFLMNIDLRTEVDRCDYEGRAVTLMTLDAVKGLEFPVVFFAGCEEGKLGEVQELWKVGMTRAKEEIVISWVRERLLGDGGTQQVSRFVKEMPGDCVLQHAARERRRTRKDVAVKMQASLF